MPINILYPAQIDNVISIPTAIDSVTGVGAVVVNTLQQAIFAVEGELGVKPSGTYATVRARLDALEALYDGLFTTPFTKDLSGYFPSPTVVGIYNRPIANIAPQPGQALVWSGLYWLPVTVSGGGGGVLGGDVTGMASANTVVKLQGNALANTAPSTGQVLTWTGSNWAPENAASGFTAGGDLSGTSTNQIVSAIQGVPTPPGSTAVVGDTLIVQAGIDYSLSFYFDSVNDIMWVGSWSTSKIFAFNATSLDLVGTVDVSASPIRKMTGDANYVYACTSLSLSASHVFVISKLSYQLVGILVTNAGATPTVRDLTIDGSGNLWGSSSGRTSPGEVYRWTPTDIANAISSYPTPHAASANVALANDAETLCWDSTTNQIFACTNGPGAITQTIYRISTGATPTLLSCATYAALNFTGFHGIVSYQGFLWVSSYNNAVLQIDPTTFPPTGTPSSPATLVPVTNINTTTTLSGDIYIDQFTQTILVQDQGNFKGTAIISRIYATGPNIGTVASEISLSGYTYTAGYATSLSRLWISNDNNPSVSIFTNTIGSEAFVQYLVGASLQYGTPVIPTPSIDIQFVDTVITGVTRVAFPGGQLTGSTPIVYYTSIPAQIQVIGSGTAGAGQALTPYTFPTGRDLSTGRQVSTAYCLTSTGTIALAMPQPSATWYGQDFWSGFGSGFNGSGYWIKVVDDQNNAATHNVTINGSGNGDQVEDPATPGTFRTSVTLSVNSFSYTWEFDGTNWKLCDMTSVIQIDGARTQDYGGTGTKVYVLPTETRLGVSPTTDGGSKVDSFVNYLGTTTDGYHQIATIEPNGIGVSPTTGNATCDFAISILGVDESYVGDFWRGDLVFTVIWQSGTPTIYNSSGSTTSIAPTNIRSNGALAYTYSAEAIASGSTIIINVEGHTTGNINWSCIGQLQWVL